VTAKPQPARATPVGPDEQITVAGELGRRSATVTSFGMSLVAGIGADTANRTYLVPFVDCFGEVEIGDDQSFTRQATLTFDNVAFLIGRISAEYGEILDQLSQMSLGDLRPEPSRLKFAADALESAARDMTAAARSLRNLQQIDTFAE
jgi:hypothetical protein